MVNIIEDIIMSIANECDAIFKESEHALSLILAFEVKKGNSSSTTKRKHELASIMSSAKYKSAIIHENIDFVLEELEYGNVESLMLELNDAFNEVEKLIEVESLNLQNSIVNISNLENNMSSSSISEFYYDEYEKLLSSSYDAERGLTSLYGESEALSDIMNIIAEIVLKASNYETQNYLSQSDVGSEGDFEVIDNSGISTKIDGVPNITINININDSSSPADPFSRF